MGQRSTSAARKGTAAVWVMVAVPLGKVRCVGRPNEARPMQRDPGFRTDRIVRQCERERKRLVRGFATAGKPRGGIRSWAQKWRALQAVDGGNAKPPACPPGVSRDAYVGERTPTSLGL